MSRVLQITLMWLLALAVPAQGFAAASMFGCANRHSGALGMQSHALGTQAHSHATGIPQHSHDRGDADSGHHPEATPELEHGPLVKADVPAGNATKGSCSACASCCMAPVLPSTIVSFEATSMPDFFATLDLRSVVLFLTDGPERPPRTVLV